MTELSRRMTPSPEGSSTPFRIVQLVRSSSGVVHPKVSTPLLHTGNAKEDECRRWEPSTMPAKWMLENVRGLHHKEG